MHTINRSKIIKVADITNHKKVCTYLITKHVVLPCCSQQSTRNQQFKVIHNVIIYEYISTSALNKVPCLAYQKKRCHVRTH